MADTDVIGKAGNKVFVAESLTLTRHSKFTKDNLPPAMGKLNAAAISTPGALGKAIPGVDVTYINGIKTLHVTQNSIIEVDVDEQRDVFGNQRESVKGKSDLVYVHGRFVEVGDEDNLSVNGTQEKFVLGESEETYVGHHEVNVPTEFEKKWWEGGFTALETKGVVGALAIRGNETVIKVQDVEFALVETKANALADRWYGAEAEVGALHDTIGDAADVSPLINLGLELGPGHIP